MAFTDQQIKEIEQAAAKFMYYKRPPVEIRPKLDLEYRIEGQSVCLYEITPRWNNPNEKNEMPSAKATYVKSNNNWKVFWMRGNLKWFIYEPVSVVDNISDFFDVVAADKHNCFFG